MSLAASAPLVAVNVLSAAIWVGGMVAIFVVARASSATLEPAQRVAFFRALGRSYGVVGTAALLIALLSGALLLSDRPWDGLSTAAVIVAAALLLATAAGMAQARAMTRLRQRALLESARELAPRLRRGAIAAAALRAAIGLLTLTLVFLAAALAT